MSVEMTALKYAHRVVDGLEKEPVIVARAARALLDNEITYQEFMEIQRRKCAIDHSIGQLRKDGYAGGRR